MTPSKKAPKPQPTAAPAPAQTAEAKPEPATLETTAPAPQPGEKKEVVSHTPAPVSKQMAMVDKLKAAWREARVDISKLEQKQDGKFVNLLVTPEWPIVQIGPTGGIALPQIRSYPKAWEAALNGLAIWTKQQARDQKKAAAPAPQPEQKKEVTHQTPTARKQEADAKLEAQLA